MSATDELNKLKKLRDDGTITDEQYERARKKILDEEGTADGAEEPTGEHPAEPGERRPRRARDEDDEDRAPRVPRKKVREWCMLLHLSLFAGHTIPLGGIIAPIVIWQVKKEEMPELDEHGKNAVNWILSFLIYLAVSAVLCLVVVGFVLLPAVLILNIVFPIIAAVKASEGRVWKYPLAIQFFK